MDNKEKAKKIYDDQMAFYSRIRRQNQCKERKKPGESGYYRQMANDTIIATASLHEQQAKLSYAQFRSQQASLDSMKQMILGAKNERRERKEKQEDEPAKLLPKEQQVVLSKEEYALVIQRLLGLTLCEHRDAFFLHCKDLGAKMMKDSDIEIVKIGKEIKDEAGKHYPY